MKHYKTKRLGGVLTAVMLTLGVGGAPQSVSAQPSYLGEIFPVGFNFCPRSSLQLNGQLLAISSNNALFSLLGTIYGGDGRTTFALPDLRGRIPLHNGQGPGLSNRPIGQKAGSEVQQLTVANMPSHNHIIASVNQDGDKAGPVTDLLAKSSSSAREYHDGPPDSSMDPRMVSMTGSNLQFSIENPFLAINWCIVDAGIYPSRS